MQALAKSLIKDVEAAKSSAAELEASVKGLGRYVDKVEKLKPGLVGFEKAYLNMIKVSDGLTSARPATLKAIAAATSKPTPDSVIKANSEIERHLQEVKKVSGSDKRYPKFKSAAEGLAGKLEKLVG